VMLKPPAGPLPTPLPAGAPLRPGRLPRLSAPLVIAVMDGVGLRAPAPDGAPAAGDALALARTPTLDALWARYGRLPLAAHGRAVGMPTDADMGNSEVGHNALGAGRVFEQGASLVRDAIASGALWEGEGWRWLIEGALATEEPMHWIGLLSDGNVHSHQDHLHALLRRAAAEGVRRGRVHALWDGRDVSEVSAHLYLARLEEVLAELNAQGLDYRVASGGGRMTTTMDRYEADWAMVERGWRAHVLGEGPRHPSAAAALAAARAAAPGIGDQALPPFVVVDAAGEPVGPIRDGASVCLFNFRGDRAIELTRAFEEGEGFGGFGRAPVRARFAGMTQYDGDLKRPARFLVSPPQINGTMGELLARSGVRQLACSETQKFGHVTYFWNGNRSGAFDPALETYVEVPSDGVPFEERPWMKAAEVTDVALRALEEGRHALIRLNYANGDMVGHTGDLRATVLALEALDLSLARLLRGVERAGGLALITADHGNAEQMYELDKQTGAPLRGPDGAPKPLTSHTLNPVPLTLFDPHGKAPRLLTAEEAAAAGLRPGLANVAATALELMGFEAPEGYERSVVR